MEQERLKDSYSAQPRPRNEAIDQYEIGLDDVFQREKKVQIDSSLGVLHQAGSKEVR